MNLFLKSLLIVLVSSCFGASFAKAQIPVLESPSSQAVGQHHLLGQKKNPSRFLKVGALFGTNSFGYMDGYWKGTSFGFNVGETNCVYEYEGVRREWDKKYGIMGEYGFLPRFSILQEFSLQSSNQRFWRDETCDTPIDIPPYVEREGGYRSGRRYSQGFHSFSGISFHTNTSFMRFGMVVGMGIYHERWREQSRYPEPTNFEDSGIHHRTTVSPGFGFQWITSIKAFELGMQTRFNGGRMDFGRYNMFQHVQASFSFGVILL